MRTDEVVTNEKNSQVFLLYSEVEQLPSKNSALVRIRQKRAEYNEMTTSVIDDADD